MWIYLQMAQYVDHERNIPAIVDHNRFDDPPGHRECWRQNKECGRVFSAYLGLLRAKNWSSRSGRSFDLIITNSTVDEAGD